MCVYMYIHTTYLLIISPFFLWLTHSEWVDPFIYGSCCSVTLESGIIIIFLGLAYSLPSVQKPVAYETRNLFTLLLFVSPSHFFSELITGNLPFILKTTHPTVGWIKTDARF